MVTLCVTCMKWNSLIIAFFALAILAQAETVTVQPQGEFAEIDVASSYQEFTRLLRKSPRSIERVLAAPGSYNPSVLYALAGALFQTGRKDDAMFYFYLGQLRARSDANKTLDPSAEQAVDVLNQEFGESINQYAFRDIPKLKATVSKVLAKDSEWPRDYDARWISLHGADAYYLLKVRMKPADQWDAINEKTRKTYLEEFKDVISEIESN